MSRTGWVKLVVLGFVLLGPILAQAGTEFGSFVWQVGPFCNVVTLNVVQEGPRVHTIDPVALELQVGGGRALRLEPATSVTFGTAPNVIAGFSGNGVGPGVVGATIAGGGSSQGCPPCPNNVSGNFGTVGGGRSNTAGGVEATVGGGHSNAANGLQATIAGGAANAAIGSNTTVSGGANNLAGGLAAAVGGGATNTASGDLATVAGGEGNTASGSRAIVAGGNGNTASNSFATVGGGVSNTASGVDSTVAGGSNNLASVGNATVGGGNSNRATGGFSTVPGGVGASASLVGQMAYASGQFAAIGDAQSSLYVLRNSTSDATPTELFLNGAGARVTVAAGRTITYDILIAARGTGGQSAGFQMLGVIENVSGTTTQLTGFTKTILGRDVMAWDANVTADNGSNALVITVTGSAVDVRWVAVVRTAEVAN